MNATAAAIAHTLDANHASVALVLDMADTLEETGELVGLVDRSYFIVASTRNLARGLRMDIGSIEAADTKSS